MYKDSGNYKWPRVDGFFLINNLLRRKKVSKHYEFSHKKSQCIYTIVNKFG